MSTASIRRARAGEVVALSRLVAEAFSQLPVSGWLVDDPAERRTAMAGLFEILIEHAIAHGDVEVMDGPDGPVAVAVWFGPGPMPEIDDYDERLAVACGTHTIRFVRMDDLMRERHPAAPDHAYLALLAVDGEYRDQGLGSVLLAAHHAGLGDTPAYLEASSQRSRTLYLRHGYVDHGAPFGFDGIDAFYPMWRAGGQLPGPAGPGS
jgi:GNAT superfamily N-acetyltransferase